MGRAPRRISRPPFCFVLGMRGRAVKPREISSLRDGQGSIGVFDTEIEVLPGGLRPARFIWGKIIILLTLYIMRDVSGVFPSMRVRYGADPSSDFRVGEMARSRSPERQEVQK